MRRFPYILAHLLASCSYCAALRHGEHVILTKRTQFNEMRTEWTPVLREWCPRFSEDTEVELPLAKPELLADNNELKISFSFDHDKVVTPWITFAHGSGLFLKSLKFTITYSGDHTTQVRWRTEYTSEYAHHSQWPKTVWLHYTWVELVEQDVQFGLNMLFMAGFSLALAVVVCSVLSSQPLFEDEEQFELREERDFGKSKAR